jgi:thioredoxin reductase
MRDVIVIGARVAGSSTAMPLARKGLDVLNEYLSPGNLFKVIGVRGMAGIMLGKLFSGRSRTAAVTPGR